MTDVGEEQRFRPVDLRQRIGAPALFLESARAGKAGGGLARQKLDEAGIALIVFPIRVDFANKAADRPFLSLDHDRKNDGLDG